MAGVCRVCGVSFDRRRRNAAGKVVGSSGDTQTCPNHRWLRASNDALVDKETRYEKDIACQLFVAVFRGGSTLDSIAEALGVSRERVRQIEGEAMAKLRARLKVGDVGEPHDFEDPWDEDEELE